MNLQCHGIYFLNNWATTTSFKICFVCSQLYLVAGRLKVTLVEVGAERSRCHASFVPSSWYGSYFSTLKPRYWGVHIT